jgi:hypothetical protein
MELATLCTTWLDVCEGERERERNNERENRRQREREREIGRVM